MSRFCAASATSQDFNAAARASLAVMRVPFLLDTALPFAFLFAALLSLLGLSRKLELVVARASGVSVWGFLRAPFAGRAGLRGARRRASQSARRRAEGKREQCRGGAVGAVAARRQRALVPAGGRRRGLRSSTPAPSSIDGLRSYGVTAFVFDAAGKFREKVTAPRANYEPGRWILTDATVVSASSAPTAGRALRAADRALPPRSSGAASSSRRRLALVAAGLHRDGGAHGPRPRPLPRSPSTRSSTGPLFLLAMVMIAATVSLRLTRYGGTWRLVLTGAAAGFLLYAADRNRQAISGATGLSIRCLRRGCPRSSR